MLLMHPVPGFQLGTACAGIKKPGRKDLVVMALEPGSTLAAVFTRNAFCAAPVQLGKSHLKKSHLKQVVGGEIGGIRYLVTNTGNANAGTGEQGMADAQRTCAALAEYTGVEPWQVLPFSTGVIGEPLPVDKLITALPLAVSACSEQGWADAAEGIMTTDTRPKGASRQICLSGKTITITGISKGAGMIKPNMATMLGYVATDAAIEPDLLQSLLSESVEASFNRITVDGDTSTNDSLVLVATGKSGLNLMQGTEDLSAFRQALKEICIELAQAIVWDGEGATKFVTISVEGGGTAKESLAVAYTVAESPLVKTALYASDPNWGRILAAIGRAGLDGLDVSRVSVWLGDVLIAENGGRAASYTEAAGQAVMDKAEIAIRIHLGRGDYTETVWTTDLSYDYVKINAEYRT